MNYSLFDQGELLALIRFDLENKNYDMALEKIKFSLAQEVFPVEVYAYAGKIYASLFLFDKAKISFEAYLSHVPNAYVELFQLGMIERDTGNRTQSIEIWRRVLDIHPDYTDALFYLGETCIALNMVEEGRDWLFRLLETAPDNSHYIGLADQLLNNIRAH